MMARKYETAFIDGSTELALSLTRRESVRLFVLFLMLISASCRADTLPLLTVSQAASYGVSISPSSFVGGRFGGGNGPFIDITVVCTHAFLNSVDISDPTSWHRTRMRCADKDFMLLRHGDFFPQPGVQYTVPDVASKDDYNLFLSSAATLGYMHRDVELDLCSEKTDLTLMRIAFNVRADNASPGFPPIYEAAFGSIKSGSSTLRVVSLSQSNDPHILGFSVESIPPGVISYIAPLPIKAPAQPAASAADAADDYISATGERQLLIEIDRKAPPGSIDGSVVIVTGSGTRFAIHVSATVTQ